MAVRGDTAQFKRAMRDAEDSTKRVQRAGESLTRVGSTMSRRVTMPLLATAAASMKVGADFQQSMNRVQAISQATTGEFTDMREQAKELGATTQFSASQAADGMGYLAQAGFDANEIVSAMPGTLELAAAAQMGLAQAADLASNVLQGFNLEVGELSRVNDTLVATATKSNTSVAQLGQGLSFVAPVAAAAGLEIEQVAAAAGLMGDAGIQATRAGTSLRSAISKLLNPTGPAADAIERLGLNALDADGSLKGLDEIVGQLESSGADAADMMEIFGLRAGPAMQALVSRGSESLVELEGKIRDSGGIAGEVAEVQMQGLTGALRELRSAAEAAGIAVFDAGVGEWAEDTSRNLADLLRSLADTNPEMLRFLTITGGLAAASGPALMVMGGLAQVYGRVGSAGQRAVGAVQSLRVQMALGRMEGLGYGRILATIVNPKLLALGAAVAVGAVAWKRWSDSARQARQAAEEYAMAIQESLSATEAETRATVANRLAKEGLLDKATELGISTSDLVGHVLGERDATERVTEALLAHRVAAGEASTEKTVAGIKAGELADALAIEADAWRDTRDEALRTALASEDYSTATQIAMQDTESMDGWLGAVALHHGQAGDAAQGHAGNLDMLGDETEETVEELRSLSDILNDLIGVHLDAERAALAFADEIDGLSDSVDEDSRSLNANKEVGREHRGMVLDSIEAAMRHAEAIEEQTGDTERATEVLFDHIDALKDELGQLGFNEDKIDDYIGSLGLIPDDVWTEVVNNAPEAQRDIMRYRRQIAGLPSTHRLRLQVSGASGLTRAVSQSGGMLMRHSGGGVEHTPETRRLGSQMGLRPREVPMVALEGETVRTAAQERMLSAAVPRFHEGTVVRGGEGARMPEVNVSPASVGDVHVTLDLGEGITQRYRIERTREGQGRAVRLGAS